MNAGIWSIIVLIVSIAIIVLGTSKWKINAFLVLIGVAYFYAFLTGADPVEVVTIVRTGFGELILKVGLIYLCGTIMGTLLEKTGAAIAITKFILKVVGRKKAPLAVAFSGYVVAIPINCDPGFIILNTVSKGIAKDSGFSIVTMGVALACGLYSTHTLVPPTAGPTAAAGVLGADLGRVILLGMIVAFVTTLVGYFFATKFCKNAVADLQTAKSGESIDLENIRLPNTFHSFLPILYPLTMICLNSFAQMESAPFGSGFIVTLLQVLGEPTTALFCSVLIAFTLVPRNMLQTAASSWVTEAMQSAATILFITAAGGAFAGALKASPMIDFLSETMVTWNMGILLPFLITAILKTAQGSSTVSMVTTSAIIAPLLPQLGIDPALCVLAIGAGSMVVSHTNDSYFWVVSQFSGMSVSTALKNYTTMTGLSGVVAFSVICVMNFLNI